MLETFTHLESHENVKLEELEWQASLLRNTVYSSIPMYNYNEEID